MPLPSMPFNEALSNRFAQVLYQCLETVGSTKAALYLMLKGREGLHLVSHYGFPRLVPPPGELPSEHPLALWVQRERRTFLVNNAGKVPELADLVQGSESPRAMLTPVYDRGEWMGFLLQRDRVRGELYDLGRDEAPTVDICGQIVEAAHEFRFLFMTGSPKDSRDDVPTVPVMEQVPALPIPVPPSDSMIPPVAGAAVADPPAGADPIHDDHPTAIAPAGDRAPATPLRPGMFLPEQRTFFWEAAALLGGIAPLEAVALWMDEPHELRPILAWSRRPLSEELKQQILAHAAYHIHRVDEKDLRIHAKPEWELEQPLQGVFQTYLPAVLMEEGGGQDLLLLFRLDERPFSDQEQVYIKQVARMLGFHLQEGRLHEQYHRAFLSVAHRILSNMDGGAPSLRTHSLNTAKLARSFALRLELSSQDVEAVGIAAILHDVGTLLLDAGILAKLELSPEELAKVRTHPVLASTFLKDFRFPFDVLRIIRHHHERWDGTGYPDGLRGEEIPLGSRIINIVEAFDVMSSGYGYRAPRPTREIVEELRKEASAQFDPELVVEFIDFLSTKLRRNE